MSSDATNRRDESAKATRGALLAAGRALFGERGYTDVSLAEIARAARATTGALYHHFADKKQLFAAVAESIEADLVAELARDAPAGADPWALVAYAVSGTLEYASRSGVARVIFRDAPNVLGPSAWREIEMRYGFGQLHALLDMLAKSGRLAFDPQIVAAIVLGSTVQTVDLVVNAPDPAATLASGRAALLALLETFRGSDAKGSR